MNELIRIGVDLAKNVFQVHGVDRRERPAWCKRLPRERWLQAVAETAPPGCEIGMESCGGAHLGPATAGTGFPREADRSAVREALCEKQQERRQRRGSDL